jgi:hypothetical protein
MVGFKNTFRAKSFARKTFFVTPPFGENLFFLDCLSLQTLTINN